MRRRTGLVAAVPGWVVPAVMVMAVLASPVAGQTPDQEVFLRRTAPGPTSGMVTLTPGPNSITQSLDLTLLETVSIGCRGGDDSYLRRFDLWRDHGIVNQLDVTSIDVGVEYAEGATVTVNLYTIPANQPLIWANLSLIGSATAPVADTTLSVVNLPVSGTVVQPAAEDLVVEIFAPDSTGLFSFFIGANSLGQTGPTYLSAPICSAVEPTDSAQLGYPDMHMLLVVNAIEAQPPPTVPAVGHVGAAALALLLLLTGVSLCTLRRG